MEKELLGKHCEIKTGKLDVNAEVIGGQYPFFTCSKNHKLIDTYAFDGEYILVAGNGDLNVKYYNGKFNAYQRTYAIKPKETLDGRYLYNFLESYVGKLREQSIGGVIKYIKLGNLTEAKIPLPPLSTQKKIAAILDAADKHRTTTAALIDKYTDLAQSLFLEMFGDLSENVKHRIGTVGDVTQLVKDGPHTSPKYSTEGIPILSTRNIRPYRLILEELKYVSTESYLELTRRFKPQRGDILLTKGGTTGYAKVVDWDWDFCIWVHIAALRVDQTLTNPKYLEGALNSYYAYHQSQLYTRGIANKDLGLKRLIKIEIPIPSFTLQNQFAERVQAIEVQKKQAEDALVKAEELFQRLLQDAFKGVLGTDGQEPAHSN